MSTRQSLGAMESSAQIIENIRGGTDAQSSPQKKVFTFDDADTAGVGKTGVGSHDAQSSPTGQIANGKDGTASIDDAATARVGKPEVGDGDAQSSSAGQVANNKDGTASIATNDPSSERNQERNGLSNVESSSGTNGRNTPDEKSKVSSSVPVYNYRLNGELRGHPKNIQCIVVQHDGKRVLTACEDETLKYWSIKQQKCLSTLRGHKGAVLACSMFSMATSVDDSGENVDANQSKQRDTYAASGSADKHVRLWKMDVTFKPKSKEDPGGRGWKCEWCFENVHEAPVNLLRFSKMGGLRCHA